MVEAEDDEEEEEDEDDDPPPPPLLPLEPPPPQLIRPIGTRATPAARRSLRRLPSKAIVIFYSPCCRAVFATHRHNEPLRLN
jgi:hypothetical protein